MTDRAAEPDLSVLYQDTYARLAALVADLDDTGLATPVPACPGWSVQDVVAHLLAISQDSLAGQLRGIPGEDITAAQVARFKGHDIQDMLAAWAQTARPFGDRLAAAGIWPGVIDIATHEQDIRGALGRPGARDSDAVRLGVGWLLSVLNPPVPMRVLVEDAEFRIGPSPAAPNSAVPSPAAPSPAVPNPAVPNLATPNLAAPSTAALDAADLSPAASSPAAPSTAGTSPADAPGKVGPSRADPSEPGNSELTLRTCRFEVFRWRLGRRSRAQLAALDWSGDPTPVLDHLVIFGPSDRDIIE
jgi:uncharacterized protein (TIGR03083 family)